MPITASNQGYMYFTMVTQKCAIKSHLNHCCQVETIVLYQLVFTVKTVKIQLDDLVARHKISMSTGRLWAWRSPTHRGIKTNTALHYTAFLMHQCSFYVLYSNILCL